MSWGLSPGEARVLVSDVLAGMGREEDRENWEWDGRTEAFDTFMGRALTVVAMVAVILPRTWGSE